MKATVLNAIPAGNEAMTTLRQVVDRQLAGAGYDDVHAFDLGAAKLAYCQGEFDCWVKTPGRCRSVDLEVDILASLRDADALVLLGPLTFGGHGYLLKRALDRLLPLLSPFFQKRSLLTHHELRYGRGPRLFSLAWAPSASAQERETFAALNDANAINYEAPGCAALVFEDPPSEAWDEGLARLFATPTLPGATLVKAAGGAKTGRAALRDALLAAAAPEHVEALPVERAAIVIGSAKIKGTSASETLARALAHRLGRASIVPELHFVTELLHDDARSAATAVSIAACDLFVLVTPLYVDSLPALATHALELVARARAEARPAARFAMIVNCGFPEAEQNRTALRIGRHFAGAAGYAWCGGLPLGGGGVVQPGTPLDQARGPVAHVVRALDFAAPALADGRGLPVEAITSMADPMLPDAVYRFIGDLGWRWAAHGNGVPQRELRARPALAARPT